MIQLLPQLKIFLAYQPVDFRKGIDGLVSLCRNELEADPYDGSAFVFRNRRGTALRILTFDGHGFWLCIRRFSRGTLQWWPTPNTHSRLHPLQAHQLSVLLYNGLPDRASFLPPWRELPQHSQAASEVRSAVVSSPL
jgi:transposase